jgi:hypothetical protein
VILLGALVGLACFGYYYSQGLSTVHYDAKAHLVVARRIVDSATPGYAQMGAHWLPLVHLLYLPFVAFDAQYRSALMPGLFSVAAFVWSGWLVYRISRRLTGSVAAGFLAATVLLGNANLQFLQSAPLTEPVFMALSLVALDALMKWRAGGWAGTPWLSAVFASLAALCRYEGWLLLCGVVVVIASDLRGRHISARGAARAAGAYVGMIAAPALLHFGYVYARLGDTFFHRVARGSAAPYETLRRPLLSGVYHVGELAQAIALIPLLLGLAGTVFCLWNRDLRRRCCPYLVMWLPSLMNMAALYWGLIYRVRYSILLLPAAAVFGSILVVEERMARRALIFLSLTVFALPWISWLFPREWEYHLVAPGPGILLLPAATLLLLLAAQARRHYYWPLVVLVVLSMQIPVLEGESRPMLAEALEHRHIDPEHRVLLGYLGRHYDGSRILVDLGRVAPFMYETGIPLKEFVCHDGANTDWDQAIAAPRNRVGWICAEDGDEVWRLLESDPELAAGYSLAVQTRHYVLYRRNLRP